MIKKLVLVSVLTAFSGAAMATTVPLPPIKPAAAAPVACKIGDKNAAGKIIKRCRKSPYKAPIKVAPYAGKPKTIK